MSEDTAKSDDGKVGVPGGMRRIVIVDDHPIVRRGLAELISLEPDLVVCAQAGSCAEALVCVEKDRPDLVIVDIALDDGSGIDLARDVRSRYPKLPILILSMYEETLYAARALRAGANGYVMKVEAPDVLLRAIREILNGEFYVGEKVAGRLLKSLLSNLGDVGWRDGLGSLSDRELQVFEMVGRGLTTREIASKLSISTKTIETHRSHIKNKLQLKHSAELAHYAVNWVNGNGGGGGPRSIRGNM